MNGKGKIGRLVDALDLAEWTWRVVSWILVLGGGVVSTLLARASRPLVQYGPIVWLAVGVLTAMAVALVIYLVRTADLKRAMADMHRALAAESTQINPLATTFSDAIIPLEELRVPGELVHENKRFERCKFVGPGALAIQGGNYVNTGFFAAGTINVLPAEAHLTGVVLLRNCTVVDCQFYRTTLLVSAEVGQAMAEHLQGASVVGLPDA